MSGDWLKIYRSILKHPMHNDPDFMWVWVVLLNLAEWTPVEKYFDGRFIMLCPGQFITGRKVLSDYSGVNESKIQRILKRLEIEQRIEQRCTASNRLITIVNWKIYQDNEQPNEQQVNNERTTSEQQVNTLIRSKEYKEDKETKSHSAKTRLIPFDSYSPEVQWLTNLFVTNTVEMYPTSKDRLHKDEQAYHLQYIIDHHELTKDDLKRVILYLKWSHTESKKNERVFDWGMQIRSTAKLLKRKRPDEPIYADVVLNQANSMAQRLRIDNEE